ncbi:microtubule-associated proteins 1A/1B light chain 3A-like isoform X2 [Phlebotomus argentipes]|uniref:microtubule-associated proteins 1A/1B light chain 3A-like isoform X2 n=1 Tax=Phlebotomus argentipes TaxID=94469 RepID=UPI002892CAE5|nr:microtubule-associated proteins 1A/1B light chain 3A-like isoform X2 [Phlebotomus argentipes]
MHSIDLFSSTCYKQKTRGESYGPKNHPINVLRYKFPTKVPVILERYRSERDLPDIGQRKYVIPQEMSMSQFHQMVRQRMNLSPSKALFFLVNNRTMICLSKSLLEVYDEFQDADGFLYITYASQDVFG